MAGRASLSAKPFTFGGGVNVDVPEAYAAGGIVEELKCQSPFRAAFRPRFLHRMCIKRPLEVRGRNHLAPFTSQERDCDIQVEIRTKETYGTVGHTGTGPT